METDCVKHSEGWCACRGLRYRDNAQTLCKHFVIAPLGFERREPTCPECLNVLTEKKNKMKTKAEELSHGEIVDEIARACEEMTADQLIELYSQLFAGNNIRSLGDSMYRVEKQTNA